MAIRGTDVYSILKSKIISLEFYPGQILKESSLVEQLHVSRTPVREALILLANEMLVQIYPQRGTYVSKIDMEYVRQLMMMRHILETNILLDLCRRKLQLQSQFSENMFALSLAVQKRSIVDHMRIDGEFHRKLFDCAGYPIIWDKLCRSHNTRYRLLDLSVFNDRLQDTYDAHKRILDCISDGDEEELCRVLKRHHDPNITRQRELIERFPKYFGPLETMQNQNFELAAL